MINNNISNPDNLPTGTCKLNDQSSLMQVWWSFRWLPGKSGFHCPQFAWKTQACLQTLADCSPNSEAQAGNRSFTFKIKVAPFQKCIGCGVTFNVNVLAPAWVPHFPAAQSKSSLQVTAVSGAGPPSGSVTLPLSARFSCTDWPDGGPNQKGSGHFKHVTSSFLNQCS